MAVIPERLRSDAETLWAYHDMHHEPVPCDVGIGLGSHDLGVAMVATDLFHRGLFPHIVFTGANAPTTIERFPRGEAVHYREYAMEHGVPAEAILVDSTARNTAENIENSRSLLEKRGIAASVLLMSRPYQQRRACATCRKVWSEVEVRCTSRPVGAGRLRGQHRGYEEGHRHAGRDTQRIEVYAEQSFAIPQEVPVDVRAAYERLVAQGFTSRLI